MRVLINFLFKFRLSNKFEFNIPSDKTFDFGVDADHDADPGFGLLPLREIGARILWNELPW